MQRSIRVAVAVVALAGLVGCSTKSAPAASSGSTGAVAVGLPAPAGSKLAEVKRRAVGARYLAIRTVIQPAPTERRPPGLT